MPTAADETDTLADLMHRYLDGDERALGRIYARVAPRLRVRLGRQINERAQVDDLVQLTFVKAHHYRDRFQWGDGDPSRAVIRWYMLVAKNVAIDDLRRRVRARRRLLQVQQDGLTHAHLAYVPQPRFANAEDAMVDRESRCATAHAVREAVRSLPPAQRQIIELHRLAGMSTIEIAEKLQVRPGTLRVRAHRAYRRLAEVLGESADPTAAAA
jgi:RNA polymerase sigma-70 factor (ECF subfamily)